MPLSRMPLLIAILGLWPWLAVVSASRADEPAPLAAPNHAIETARTPNSAERPSLNELKQTGLQRSRFRDFRDTPSETTVSDRPPQANLEVFETTIWPLLQQHCVACHGPEVTEGNIRIDTLDPNLLQGTDTDWWSEIFSVLAKEEMPPPDESHMDDATRSTIVDWLSSELQSASILRRQSGSRSSFRRLTRYEYEYALQDLLGLPWAFAKDLPPEPRSEAGFENSAELLQMSVSQFEIYHRSAREALYRAIVIGDRPSTLHWGIPMIAAAEREWPGQAERLEAARRDLANEPEKLEAELARLEESFHQPHGTPYYRQLSTGRTARAQWDYPEARYAFAPTDAPQPFPDSFDCVAILPAERHHNLVVELGNQLPDEGIMRVKIRASRVNTDSPGPPSVQLLFGWQATNEGRALMRVSQEDVVVTGTPDAPQIITWDVPLGEIYPRNSVRKTSPMGAIPSPSEYIRIANSSASPGDIQIDYVSVEAPVHDQLPSASHRRIFIESSNSDDERAYAGEILQYFMTRAWRRPPTAEELNRKLERFDVMRTQSESFEQAIVEVLATVLSSPQFLYVGHASRSDENPESPASSAESTAVSSYELATRLALFLWCSIPDDELLGLAATGDLSNKDVLAAQVDRMLADPRSNRLSKHFVHQWLNLDLLDFANFELHQPGFDPLLKEAMQQEPVALFAQILQRDGSVLDFVHADYAMVNERLARHYGLPDVLGNHFRPVPLDGDFRRGGLLTQPGLLAMNADWPDSHPLKRAIWILECLLDDPPPPPPPAVPQIDLADPEIARMSLKERIENHRNHAACKSCHVKIDPWGIAFENYDAMGQWRDQVRGEPVDAASELFNGQTIDGMDGLKRFLLLERQDQFVEAMVAKLTTYALGRPLSFADHAQIDTITAQVRKEGDGLKTLIRNIVVSDLFRFE